MGQKVIKKVRGDLRLFTNSIFQQNGPQGSTRVLKWSKKGPKRVQKGSKKDPKESKNYPEDPEGSRRVQRGPEGSKRIQKGSKRGPKGVQKESKEGP